MSDIALNFGPENFARGWK